MYWCFRLRAIGAILLITVSSAAAQTAEAPPSEPVQETPRPKSAATPNPPEPVGDRWCVTPARTSWPLPSRPIDMGIPGRRRSPRACRASGRRLRPGAHRRQPECRKVLRRGEGRGKRSLPGGCRWKSVVNRPLRHAREERLENQQVLSSWVRLDTRADCLSDHGSRHQVFGSPRSTDGRVLRVTLRTCHYCLCCCICARASFRLPRSWPALAAATYVATSRLVDNRHFLSDVVFGAALGEAAGWTIVGRHGKSQYALRPVPIRGGMMVALVRQPD